MRRVAGIGGAVVLGAFLGSACGGGEGPRNPTGVSPQDVGARGSRTETGGLRGHVVAQLGTGVIGPWSSWRSGSRGEGSGAGLVAWVTGAEGSGRRILVVPVADDGKPRDAEKVAAFVGNDTTTLVVRPMRGSMPGFVLAWTSLTDRGESLWTTVVGDDGVPRGKPVELARTNDDVAWVDVVPSEAGASVIWAEETRDGDATIVAAALSGSGAVRGAPARVSSGALGWAAVEVPGGAAIATVTRDPAARAKRQGGALLLHSLDPDARVVGSPVTVSASPIMTGDVELARAGDRVLLAWTDRATEEHAVVAASVDDKRHVEGPRRIVESRGGAALLGMTHGEGGTAVLFEAPLHRRSERRRVHVGKLASNLAFEGKPASFEVAARAPLELARSAGGFTLVGAMAECSPRDPGCEEAARPPTMVRMDAQLGVVQREPLVFGGEVSELGWGLACDGEVCRALTIAPGKPTRLRVALVRPRDGAAASAPEAAPPPAAKQAFALEDEATVARGEAVVDIAVARAEEATMVVALTTPVTSLAPARDVPVARPNRGQRAPEPARAAGSAFANVTARLVDERGQAAAPNTLASRALPTGGVAFAWGKSRADGGAVAWVGRDGTSSQVHLTRVDAKGRRTRDVRLTTTAGEASDVALAWVSDGWIVAWVDGRHGNGEVFATKVSADLSRTAREERITSAPGDASDLAMRAAPGGEHVWLAWADPRESPRDGMADIYLTTVSKRDAKRGPFEAHVHATRAHSRTPSLAPGEDGAMHVAWIEEAPLGHETPSASGFGAMWTTIGADGALLGAPRFFPHAGDGAVSSVTLDGDRPEASGEAGLRAVVARAAGDAVSLDGVVVEASREVVSPLVRLDGPTSMDVALALTNGTLFFSDDGEEPSDRRVRRGTVRFGPPR